MSFFDVDCSFILCEGLLYKWVLVRGVDTARSVLLSVVVVVVVVVFRVCVCPRCFLPVFVPFVCVPVEEVKKHTQRPYMFI